MQTAFREMHEKIWVEVCVVFYVEGNCVEGLKSRPKTFRAIINKIDIYFY